MRLEALYFYVMLCIANSKLLQSPDDTEAVVGEDVIFRCQTDFINTVEWRYKAVPSETSPFQIISKQKLINNLFKGRYEIISNAATGQYDLVIKNVQPQDAGRYTCGDIHDSNHAELTVFDRYPSAEFCTTTSTSNGNQNDCTSESLTMSCDLSYRGNQGLRLEWLEGGNRIPSTATNHANGTITSSVQLHNGPIETSKYTCRVKYLASKMTSRFTWLKTVIIAPTGNTSNLYGGCDIETIECSDSNSPHCKYTWKDENENEVSGSSSMEMAGKPNGNYTCWATCNSHSPSCSYVAKTLNYRCPEHSKQGLVASTIPFPGTEFLPLKSLPEKTYLWIYTGPILVVVAILISIAAVGLIIFRRSVCIRNKRTNARSDAERGQNDSLVETPRLNEATSS